MKKIFHFFKYIYETTQLGFFYICLVFSKGFFFYLYSFFDLLERVWHNKISSFFKNYFKRKQNDPTAFLLVVFVMTCLIFFQIYLYVGDNQVSYIDDDILVNDKEPKPNNPSDPITNNSSSGYSSGETNLYKKYGKMKIDEVDFKELKSVNSDVNSWITVDGTNVNYPVVQTTDNDYYLNHDIMKNMRSTGWVFMDFRNEPDMSDQNTIFYGHNLLNKTAFGSLQTLLSKDWYKGSNHYIVVRTEKESFVYEVFSCYTFDPEVYYLTTYFSSDDEYMEFLNTLKSRSKFDFGVDLTSDDRIITLSTCTDDNMGRKVFHAKLISTY